MPRTKVSELRGVSEAELRQRIAENRKEIAAIRLKGSLGAIEQPHRIEQMRRDIARMLTVINEQSRGAVASAPAAAKSATKTAPKTATTRTSKPARKGRSNG